MKKNKKTNFSKLVSTNNKCDFMNKKYPNFLEFVEVITGGEVEMTDGDKLSILLKFCDQLQSDFYKSVQNDNYFKKLLLTNDFTITQKQISKFDFYILKFKKRFSKFFNNPKIQRLTIID